MFEQFSLRLYEKAAAEDYQFAHNNLWVMQKVEMSTLVFIQLFDAEKISFPSLVLEEKERRTQMAPMLNQFSQVVVVHVMAGGNPPEFTGVEEYMGQPVYSIFWHVNMQTGEITVPQGQPKKFFNIRTMIESAFQAAQEGTEHTSFEEVTSRTEAQRPRAKYRHPIIAYGLIFVNLMILLLMYMDGYQVGNVTVPVQYGAILAEFVVHGGEWWRLVAAMFIHFGFSHFFANAFGILIFGTRLERYFGRRMFFIVYIFSGLAGSVVSLFNLYFFQPFAVSAGASGAVYGIVGAMFAYTRVTKRSIEFITWYVMLIYIGLGMAMGFATPGIDNFAHIGGLLMGVLIGGIYAKFKK
ncbi:MAG: rhomboid family intramembrane serine protease [Defluviitaleaceae bacterium]|nr:rhomboid family intramembrane serine protease [Defluviitaleaceae bacterium]